VYIEIEFCSVHVQETHEYFKMFVPLKIEKLKITESF